MRLRLVFPAALSVALLGSAALGQAIVTGTVVSGNRLKPVGGIEVHLVNKTFKPPIDRKVLTEADGTYEFDDVLPGENYAVDIIDPTGKLLGTDPRFPVLPSTTSHTAVPEIDISRGVTAERAEKSGGLIENDRGISPGANISNEQLRLLPLYNRNFLALGLIQPGVHDVEQGSPLQGAGFSIDGSRSTSTNFLLDGVDNVASSSNQAIPFQVNEAVREFRVTYATPSMRYGGQGSGGVVDVITSSGDVGRAGQAFHGSAFGYFNSDALNANSPLSAYSNSGFVRAAAYANPLPNVSNVIFADTSTSTSPANCNTVSATNIFCGYSPQSYNALFNLFGSAAGNGIDPGNASAIFQAGAFNPAAVLAKQDSHFEPISSKQFGGSIGGPIGKKNRYIFASYEGTLINNPTPIFERVPTALDAPPYLPPIASAGAGDAAIAQATLKLFPAATAGLTPTVTGSGATRAVAGVGTGVLGFYRGVAPNYTHVHTVQVRPDISLNTLGTLSFRYTGQLLDQLHDDTLPSGLAYPGNGADRRAQNQSAAVTYSSPFRKNLNLLSIAFTQYRVDDVAQDRNFQGNPITPNSSTGMPTVVLAGIDPQTSAATPGSLGAIGGWYDSFWQSSPASPTRSPSPITPSLDGLFPFARLGAPLSAPSKRRDTEAFLADALELRLGGRNTLTVGGEYRYQQNFSYDGGLVRGLVVANNIGEFTSDSETCVSCTPRSAFAHPSFDYELRQPMGYTGDLRSSTFGFFAENRFQPMPRMTIVTGARYDYFGQQLDSANRMWNYNAGNYGLNRQSAIGTFDAFDYQCNPNQQTFFDALYGAFRASVPAGKWACNAGGRFQLPQNKHDISGLFGLAFSPDGAYRQVIRVSVGSYYDRLPSSYNQKLLQNRPSPYDVTNPSSIYGQNFQSSYSSANCQINTQCAFGLSTLNLNSTPSATFQNYQAASGANILYERDPQAMATPFAIQFSGSYQYRFTGSWNGELNYTGSIGQRLPLVYDGNFANEFYCTTVGNICNNNTYFPVFTESHIGTSNYNSVIAQAEGRLYHGLSMHASYTISKSLDNIAGSNFPNSTDSLWTQLFGRQLQGLGNPASFALQTAQYGTSRGYQLGLPTAAGAAFRAGVLQSANIPSFDAVQAALTTTGERPVNVSHYNLPQNPLAFSSAGDPSGADYGRSDFDVHHRGVADFVYNFTDFGHRLLGGFTLSGITTVQSGQPFTIFSGPAYGQVTQLANYNPAAIRTTGNPAGYISGLGITNLPSYQNPNCPNLYAQPVLYKASSTPSACLGNGGRNTLTGPAYFSQDFAFQKATYFRAREGQAITMRAEMYNIFNRANYYNPISELSRDGVHINPEFGFIRSAHDPFRLQLAVRYEF